MLESRPYCTTAAAGSADEEDLLRQAIALSLAEPELDDDAKVDEG